MSANTENMCILAIFICMLEEVYLCKIKHLTNHNHQCYQGRNLTSIHRRNLKAKVVQNIDDLLRKIQIIQIR